MPEMNGEFAAIRAETNGEFAAVRGDIAGLRETVDTNWMRAQMLFETCARTSEWLPGTLPI